MYEGEYTDNFTTQEIIPTYDELIQCVQGIYFHLGFVILIMKFDKDNGQLERKTYVLLECENGEKYKKYKYDVQPSYPTQENVIVLLN